MVVGVDAFCFHLAWSSSRSTTAGSDIIGFRRCVSIRA